MRHWEITNKKQLDDYLFITFEQELIFSSNFETLSKILLDMKVLKIETK